jgi:YVTN family beta-propeller protein
MVLLLAVLLASPALAQPSFVAFESGSVRPIALSPDGSQLFVANTPGGRLEVFDVDADGIELSASIPVGLEPVSVAARTNNEVWVVNHLSDSISVVDVASGRVVRTLLVGDEPRDIVFAGTGGNRAFITTAHRGQHRTHGSISAVTGTGDPQFTTEGIGRADVWVFNATAPGSAIGGTPLEILTFFADTPRALAVSADGNTVYAAAFHSGNQTTALVETTVPNGFDSAGPAPCQAGGTAPGGVPGPDDNAFGDNAPETGIIVKFDGAAWRDSLGRDWSGCVNLSLPDHDVFSINANTLDPVSLVEFDHVGTILFNMVVNPISGKVYVTNLEMPNHIRFEGPGIHGGSTVQGHLSESRITVIDPVAVTIDTQHLNQHIDYSKLHTDVPDMVDVTQVQHSLATPLQPVVSSDGNTLYVAAFGSGKVGVFDTSDIEDAAFEANFDPTAESAAYLDVAGGPAGLALDETNNRLYVATRFDNAVAIVDLTVGAETHRLPLLNPEPASLTGGRDVLYDAVLTSGNGEASCSSCHIFGDFDSLAWNLGDPDGGVTINTQPIATPLLDPNDSFGQFSTPGANNSTSFHPMKGPMTTQTLRGMSTHGALHWRGDRVDGFFGDGAGGSGPDPCNEPGWAPVNTGDSTSTSTNAPCSEDLSFRNFIVAFEGLIGHEGLIATSDMVRFTDFILQVQLPPNPVAPLDNNYTGAAADGETAFFTCGAGTAECAHNQVFSGGVPGATDTVDDCDGCHNLVPLNGFFGTGGEQTFEGETQNFKVAHMRNVYQKIGMFGGSRETTFVGDQVRGVGVLHDGSISTVLDFLDGGTAFPGLVGSEPEDLEQFTLAFPSDIAPIVGQQVTLAGTPDSDTDARIALLINQAGTPFDSAVLGGTVTECDLIVKGVVNGEARGWSYQPGTASFKSDREGELHTDAQLRAFALVAGQEMTYTCVPPGSGERMGVDADLDGAGDRDELDAGTDPANAGSIFGACADGVDNDGDGLTDAVDPGCTGVLSPNSENPACDDGVDNDGDGFFDWPNDPACLDASSINETAQCQDGKNNDGQLGTDWDGGVSILGAGNGDPNGPDPQCTQPWLGQEKAVSSMCGLGAELALVLPLLGLAHRARRRVR